jgi:hypothetical protein
MLLASCIVATQRSKPNDMGKKILAIIMAMAETMCSVLRLLVVVAE